MSGNHLLRETGASEVEHQNRKIEHFVRKVNLFVVKTHQVLMTSNNHLKIPYAKGEQLLDMFSAISVRIQNLHAD